MPSPREQAEAIAALVMDEFSRSGTLPGPLLRSMQTAACRRTGAIVPLDQVAAQVGPRLADMAREWTQRMLAAVDAGADPERVE